MRSRRRTRSRVRQVRLLAAAVLLGATAAVGLGAAPAQALSPVNPVEVPIDGHPANSGFLVFVRGSVTLHNDESEGTMALGGNLRIRSNYNIAAGSVPKRSTFVVPGDARDTYLYVGGGISWPSGGDVVNVENGGFSKVADDSTYTAYDHDNNNAEVNYRLVPHGAGYNTTPHLDGRSRQTPASVAQPVPSSLIDIGAAFAQYRSLTTQMGACPETLVPANAQGDPLPRPLAPGSSIYLTLTAGQTNVLNLTAQELANLSQITFRNAPTADAPLLVNITGGSYNGNFPNLAGVSGNQAPFMLWNWPTATSVTVNGGATVEGTLYAPNATLTWAPTQNVEGNIIAAAFNHGLADRRTGGVREVHDFPFSTTLSCATTPQPAHLTLVKRVTNDNGGTAVPTDWTLHAAGPTTIQGATGQPAVTDAVVDPGSYGLSESGGPGGYTASDWSCDGGSLDGATLQLAAGDDVTCTITNDDQPAHLTLVKQVINDNGGTAVPTDWTLHAAGPTTIQGATGQPAVTDAVVDPGSYGLSEDGGPGGYTASDWSCDGGSLDGATLRLAAGDDVTCTITNDDQPAHLTLVKQVINDNGGTAVPTDWVLHADGPTPIDGATGSSAVTDAVVDPGSYDLSEDDGPAGYTPTDWSCDGGSLDGATLQLAAGDDVTCTITNDDTAVVQPAHLTLVKHVINDNGGTAVPTDWTLHADGPTSIGGATGSSEVTDAVVDPGSYRLRENRGPAGYTPSDWSCDGGSLDGATLQLAAGDDVTCTITNDDQPAHLTLVKQVINDNGGTAVPTDWTLHAAGPTTIQGATGQPAVTDAVVDPGSYGLSEDGGPGGYTASDWSCDGGSLDGATLRLAAGDDVTCTITNDDQPAHLTLVKQVINDNGGTAVPTDWVLHAAGPTPIDGATGSSAVTDAVVDPGSYGLSEDGGPGGYTASDWSCDGGSLDGATLQLAAGDDVTCTITNDDQPAHLTLVKQVINDNGGTSVPTDWVLHAVGPTPIDGATGSSAVTDAVVDPGSYGLSEDGGPGGYTASDWSCDGGSLDGATLQLAAGDDVTCTITNDDQPAHLTLVKQVVNDNGGTAVPTDWTLHAAGPTTIQGATGQPAVTDAVVDPGSYGLSEDGGPGGYTASDWSCDGGSLDGATLQLAAGDDVTCTITNDDQPAHLTLVKHVINDNGGTAVPTDWVLHAAGPTPIDGATGSSAVTDAVVDPGSYDLSEDGGPGGYTASDWSCDGGSLDGATLQLAAGDDVTCTITNDDQPAHLTLVKHVTNDNGGTAVPTDWTLHAAGPTTIQGATGQPAVTDAVVDPGSYGLSESGGPAGYTASDWSCDGGSLDGPTLRLAAGDDVTCTITNDDQPAHLTLVKQVINDNGGTAVPTDWVLHADGPTPIDGATGSSAVTDAVVDPGSYGLSEDGGPGGYTASDWSCDGGSLDGATLRLAAGDDVTCTITNDDQPAHLTLVKHVINDNGGTAVPTDWVLHADGPTPIDGATGSSAVTDAVVDPGSYDLSESGGPSGYRASGWTCTGGTQHSATVALAPGDDVTCTLTNRQRANPAPPTPSTSPTATASPSTAPATTQQGGPPGALPNTGGPSLFWLVAGLAALIAGAGMILLAHRPRRGRH